MKTLRAGRVVYRIRVWTGLGVALMLALGELWAGLHYGSNTSLPVGHLLPGMEAELCDVIR